MSSGTRPASFCAQSRTRVQVPSRTPCRPEPALDGGGTRPASFCEGSRTPVRVASARLGSENPRLGGGGTQPELASGAGALSRREVLGASAAALSAAAFGVLAPAAARASESGAGDSRAASLPPASPDLDSEFGVDANVNMDTIDDYLNIPGVAYRDARLLRDPADYASIGGDSVLSFGLPGFKVVPYPQLGTLQKLPVSGAYDGDRLFDVTWTDAGEVADARPRYEESELIVADIFPKDAPIVIACGGGGYAAMTKALLTYFGYDESLLYNAGGVWDYTGYEAVELAHHDESTGKTSYYFWRADIPTLDFSLLTPIS